MGRLELRSIVRTSITLMVVMTWGLQYLARGRDFWILVPLILLFSLLVLVTRLLFDFSTNRVCPNCQADALTLRSISPFGFRYYLCKQCGIRARQRPFEDWEDASGPADARHFAAGSRASKAVPLDPTGSHYAGPLIGTHGSLLEQKRLRQVQDDYQLVPDQAPPHEL